MGTIQQLSFHPIADEDRLYTLEVMLDELHTAASEGALHTLTPLSRADLVGWLRELMYTAQETIVEIEAHEAGAPGLVRVK